MRGTFHLRFNPFTLEEEEVIEEALYTSTRNVCLPDHPKS
jgi:hypothetical protein